MTDKKVSLKKKVVGRRRAVADSDEDSSSDEYEKEMLLPHSTDFCKNCCSRPNKYGKGACSDKTIANCESHMNRISYREQLEIKVMNEQMSLQVSNENWKQLKCQLGRVDDLSGVLQTLVSSIHATTGCLVKLSNLMFDPCTELEEKCNEVRYKVCETLDVLRNIEELEKTTEEITTLKTKKFNLIKASKNFADILKRASVPSNKQLSKLDKQYDDIRTQYQDAKAKAVIKVNSSLQKKSDCLSENINNNLSPILTDMSDLEKQVVHWLNYATVEQSKIRLDMTRSPSNTVTKVPSSVAAKDARRRNCNCYDSSY